MQFQITGLDYKDAERFERQTIVAALSRLCDPRPTMEQLKTGDIVKLKSGGPVMTVGLQPSGTRGYRCHWFYGSELKEGIFALEELEQAQPEREWQGEGLRS